MNDSTWSNLQEIYHAALVLPRSERSAYVKTACAGDIDLEREVLSLLDADELGTDFPDSPVFELDVENNSERASAVDNLIGSTIDERYLIERKIASGGMSEVYFALALKLQRQPVVLKILSQEFCADSYARKKFEQEMEALLRVDHPGVVRALDSGKMPDGRPYTVMQYVEGETLRSQIPSEGMNLERAASILKQIGDALEHVHEKRIFHRDLKPENIILKRGTDAVVLVDFGIAKVRDSVVAPTTAKGVSAGTLAYMSPEQLRGEQITAASDVYSLALIAYEMITGRRPFNPASPSQLLDMQRKGVRVKAVALRPSLPGKAEDLILRGMSFNVKSRYEGAGEFGRQLARALTDEAVRGSGWRSAALKKSAAVVAFIMIAGAAAILATSKCNGDPAPTRTFTYWLMVQEVRDGKHYRNPYKSNGEETFETDDKFQLNVVSPTPAYLYVLNEGPSETNDTNFKMIYPRRTTNDGAATLGANQTIQSEWITFRGPPGNENFWLVWSPSPIPNLESAKDEAFKHPRGGLTGDNLVAVKEFLRTRQLEVKVRVFHYKANQNAVVRGPGDLLITLAQFKHR